MSEKSVYFDRVGSLKDGPGRRALLTVFFGQFTGKSHIITASDPGLQADIGSMWGLDHTPKEGKPGADRVT